MLGWLRRKVPIVPDPPPAPVSEALGAKIHEKVMAKLAQEARKAEEVVKDVQKLINERDDPVKALVAQRDRAQQAGKLA